MSQGPGSLQSTNGTECIASSALTLSPQAENQFLKHAMYVAMVIASGFKSIYRYLILDTRDCPLAPPVNGLRKFTVISGRIKQLGRCVVVVAYTPPLVG